MADEQVNKIAEKLESLKRAVAFGLKNGKTNMIVDLDVLNALMAATKESVERSDHFREQLDRLTVSDDAGTANPYSEHSAFGAVWKAGYAAGKRRTVSDDAGVFADLCYRLARHVRNTDEVPPTRWAVQAGTLLDELQALDPVRYAEMVKSAPQPAPVAGKEAGAERPPSAHCRDCGSEADVENIGHPCKVCTEKAGAWRGMIVAQQPLVSLQTGPEGNRVVLSRELIAAGQRAAALTAETRDEGERERMIAFERWCQASGVPFDQKLDLRMAWDVAWHKGREHYSATEAAGLRVQAAGAAKARAEADSLRHELIAAADTYNRIQDRLDALARERDEAVRARSLMIFKLVDVHHKLFDSLRATIREDGTTVDEEGRTWDRAIVHAIDILASTFPEAGGKEGKHV